MHFSLEEIKTVNNTINRRNTMQFITKVGMILSRTIVVTWGGWKFSLNTLALLVRLN